MHIIKYLLDIVAILVAIASAVATWFLYFTADTNLKSLDKTSETRFINEFKADFFSPKTTLIFELIEYDHYKYTGEPSFIYVEGKEDRDPDYFKIIANNIKDDLIKTNYIGNLEKIFGKDKKIFATSEVDNLLLGPLEDIGAYLKSGLISKEMMYDIFDHYIQICHKNEQIINYITALRNEDTQDKIKINPQYKSNIYENFDKINDICLEEEKSRMNKING